jgi:hypothetical protein
MHEHFTNYNGLELQGEFVSLSGPYRYAAMAGEIYMDGVESKVAKITKIQDIYTYKGRHYRPG